MISLPTLAAAFPSFSARSKLWVFIPASPLSAEAKKTICSALQTFVSGWTAHRRPLKADFLLLYDRLLLIAVDEQFEEVSGCATDALFRLIRELDSKLSTEFLLRNSRLLAIGGPEDNYRLLLEAEYEKTSGENSFLFKTGINSLNQLKTEAWEPYQEAPFAAVASFKGLL